jgi:hypothetical protein
MIKGKSKEEGKGEGIEEATLGGVNVLIKGTLLTKAMEVKMQREKQKGRPVSFSSVVYDAIKCLHEKESKNEEAKRK